MAVVPFDSVVLFLGITLMLITLPWFRLYEDTSGDFSFGLTLRESNDTGHNYVSLFLSVLNKFKFNFGLHHTVELGLALGIDE